MNYSSAFGTKCMKPEVTHNRMATPRSTELTNKETFYFLLTIPLILIHCASTIYVQNTKENYTKDIPICTTCNLCMVYTTFKRHCQILSVGGIGFHQLVFGLLLLLQELVFFVVFLWKYEAAHTWNSGPKYSFGSVFSIPT